MLTDEHFIVWMRTAALPHFRKLYGKIDKKLKKDESLVFTVESSACPCVCVCFRRVFFTRLNTQTSW